MRGAQHNRHKQEVGVLQNVMVDTLLVCYSYCAERGLQESATCCLHTTADANRV